MTYCTLTAQLLTAQCPIACYYVPYCIIYLKKKNRKKESQEVNFN